MRPEVVPRRGAAVFADGALAGLAAGTTFLLFELAAVTITDQPWALPMGMSASGCQVADINGDGRLDIVLIGGATHNLNWYENMGPTGK